MFLSKKLPYILLLSLISNISKAQSISDTLREGNVKFIETGFYASNAKNNFPFWLRSNQYGTILRNTNTQTTLGVGLYLNKKISDKFSSNLGLNSNFNLNDRGQTNIIIPELHAIVRSKTFELLVGRKRELFGLADKELSSGSYIWSGNALPLPKLQISIPEYKPLWKNGWISLKGNFAHAWFGEQSMIKDYYLHQKSLYGRIGKEHWKVKFHGGFNNQVQWGGTPKIKMSSDLIKGNKFPSDFKTFTYVVTGASLIRVNERGKLDTSLYAINDAYNRVGNHLGSIDFATEINFEHINLFIYRQQIYEDGKLFYSRKPSEFLDALTGISISLNKSLFFKKIVLENFYSVNQGILQLARNPGYGYNSYFYHGQYPNGWSYQDFTIGTPFITTQKLEADKISQTINRINSFYLGIQGNKKKTFYEIRSAYQITFPPYGVNLPRESVLSNMLKINQHFDFYDLSLQLFYDTFSNTNNLFGLKISLITIF